jgi:hypothetical protein
MEMAHTPSTCSTHPHTCHTPTPTPAACEQYSGQHFSSNPGCTQALSLHTKAARACILVCMGARFVCNSPCYLQFLLGTIMLKLRKMCGQLQAVCPHTLESNRLNPVSHAVIAPLQAGHGLLPWVPVGC